MRLKIETTVKWINEHRNRVQIGFDDQPENLVQIEASGNIILYRPQYENATKIQRGDRVVIEFNPEPADPSSRWLIPMWIFIALTLAGGLVGYILKGVL
jgi:hypothetical protein